jgi:Cft2 family RNA processing exonuclease
MENYNNDQIRLTFLGGSDSIGASCTLVEIGDICLIIDCGIRMNSPDRPLPDLSSLSGKNPDAILLTHAHTDHSGALPVLCEAFPSVPVIATSPTLDLISILFNDAIKISESERDGEIPLYNKTQVERVFLNALPVGFRQPKTIKQITITFLPAAHIIGAAMIHIASPAGCILFTGDYSVTAARTVPALDKPALPVDILISEATYGTRLHEDRSIAENKLVKQVEEITQRGGRVLIPCFAIGRAQEVILILQNAFRSKKIQPMPVYVDGMVRDVCNIYSKHEAFVTMRLAKQIRNLSNPFFTDTIRPVLSPQMRNKIISEGPCVIVASSGMLTGGASAFYAKSMLRNENDGILMTGYQDEESPGRALLSLVSKVDKKIDIYGETVDIKATVATFNLSAHADRLQMAGLIESCRPRTVVLVHGDNEARTALKNALQIRDCLMVDNGSTISRTYSARKNTTNQIPDLPKDNDILRIRALIGPSGKSLVKASDLAQLWYGAKTDALSIDTFVHRLEELGLVRRDDFRRNFLHVVAPSETDTESDDFKLEVRLKNENPKGKLLEYCMKLKIELPSFEIELKDGFYFASTKITLDGKTISSDKCNAISKKTAEQLASEHLLSIIPSTISPSAVGIIDDEIVELNDQMIKLYKEENPKGRLFEFCSKNKIKMPAYFHKVLNGKHLVKLADHHSAFETKWHSSNVKISAEHGAAEAFLAHVNSLSVENDKQENSKVDNESVKKTGLDPRVVINKFLQTKQILDFGYELTGTEVVNNQPVFAMIAWAILPDNTRLQTAQFSAQSKKDAQYRASADLLKMFFSVD